MDILVVDDDDTNRTIVKLLMERRGHAVSEAESGQDALEQVKQKPPQVIFMDLEMPGLDGFETTARLRKFLDGRHPHIPIVALTAHTAKKNVERCFEVGMSGFLEKPFNADRAEDMIRLAGSEETVAEKGSARRH